MPGRNSHASAPRPVDPARISAGAWAVLRTLLDAGFDACLVGGCVRDLVRGARVQDFDVATSAPPERALELFPRAVPIGLRHGTVMVPTADGPVDVTSFRAGARVEDDLALRDLTVNAMAWDPRREALIDPFGGQADLAARRLRAVGSAHARFAEDPLRALRAARLAAQLGFAVDPSIEPAMAEARPALRGVARERIRHELEALLVAPHADAGLRLLRRAGIEGDLAPGAAADAPALVAALEPRLPLRLAAWLRGSPAESILLRLRFPRALAQQVSRLLGLHPIEEQVDPQRPVALRRLLRRADPESLAMLFALREAELARAGAAGAPARERLEALRRSLEQVRSEGSLALHRRDLALQGREVMQILGCGPGRRVGQALEYLTEQVLEDPSRNDSRALRSLLEAWSRARGPAS